MKVNNTQQVFKSNFIKKWSLTATGGGGEGEVERGTCEPKLLKINSARKCTNKGLAGNYAARPEVNQPRSEK